MRSCRTASIVAFGAAFVAVAAGACRDAAAPTDARLKPAAPPRLKVVFVETTQKVAPPECTRLFVAVAKGTATVSWASGADALSEGDVLVVAHPEPFEVVPSGLVVEVLQSFECATRPPPQAPHAPMKTLRRAADAADLSWAEGGMHAHLDVPPEISPDLYFGRLDGVAPVAEHAHATSTETLIAVEGAGVFTVDGQKRSLQARDIVTIPRGAKHAWQPQPGVRLVAFQIYDPPGPEQRFRALDAEYRDAGARPGP